MRAAAEIETGLVADTTAEGYGVVRGEAKAAFVPGAFTGETIHFRRRRRRKNYDEAELVSVVSPSPHRVEPRCQVFGTCGGCSLQHLAPATQVSLKQAVLRDNLARIGGIAPLTWLDPITGPAWGYRRKARLGVKYVARKSSVLVGFRERGQPYITQMDRCETLVPAVGESIAALAALIDSLILRDRIPQIEVAAGDDDVVWLIFRVLDAPAQSDLDRLSEFHRQTGFWIFLQTGGPDSIQPLAGMAEPSPLLYRLPEFDIELQFGPTDFIQVNAAVNAQMVSQAIGLLDVGADSRVLDLFCGLGNFTLPLARRAAEVTGIEADMEMVRRGGANAQRNRLSNVRFRAADLAAPSATWMDGPAPDRVLLDPPRTGAAEIIDALAALAPERIVYVSCHPGTLARDARRLVETHGYRLQSAGIMDMFPQTSHVESMALLIRG